jgi:hypothetical protein
MNRMLGLSFKQKKPHRLSLMGFSFNIYRLRAMSSKAATNLKQGQTF